MFPFNILLRTVIPLVFSGFIPLHAQYSHFPITHLDWELIDFEEPSTSINSSAEEMDDSFLPAIEGMPQVTLDRVSPFSNHSSWDDGSLPLTIGLSPVDSDESYLIDPPLPSYKQNPPKIVATEPTPSLSVEILRFLENLFVLEENATIGSSLIYSSLSAQRTSHPLHIKSHDFGTGSVATTAISKLTLPLNQGHPSSVDDFTGRSLSKKSVNEPTSLGAISHKNAIPTPTRLDSEATAYFAVFPEGFKGSDSLTITTPSLTANFEDDDNTLSSKVTNPIRQRRGWSSSPQNNQWDGNSSFSWEIDDFDPTGSNEAVGTILGGDPVDDFNALNTSELNVTITANGGIDGLAVFAYGHVGGNAWNDYTGTSGFKFMQGGGGPSDAVFNNNWEDYINLTTTGIDAWLKGGDPGNNHNSFDWKVYKNGSDYYLTYNFEGDLSLSQAPEPSTYVMTGALVCFIGLNGRSRKASKQLLCALLKKSKFRQSEKNSTQLNAVS